MRVPLHVPCFTVKNPCHTQGVPDHDLPPGLPGKAISQDSPRVSALRLAKAARIRCRQGPLYGWRVRSPAAVAARAEIMELTGQGPPPNRIPASDCTLSRPSAR